MVLIKVLKRKDGSSVFVAIVLAMIVGQLLTQLTMPLSNFVLQRSEKFDGPMFNGADMYWQPIVWAVLQLVLFEVFAWLYLTLYEVFFSKKR